MWKPPKDAFCEFCERPTYACGCDTATWKARALAAENQVEELTKDCKDAIAKIARVREMVERFHRLYSTQVLLRSQQADMASIIAILDENTTTPKKG